MAAASGGAALGIPLPNPSGDGPKFRSPPGKGKPVALADITNTGKPNPTSPISVADVVKENSKLLHQLNEKIKIIEISRFESRVEMDELRFALQALRQQNKQLAQSNSQMLAELSMGNDRLKALQHELSCTQAVLKLKYSELGRKNKTGNQRRKVVSSQEAMKAIPSRVAAVKALQTDGSVTSASEHNLVESQSYMSSNTVCQEPPQDATKKRGSNKRKLESSEYTMDANIMQDNYGPHLEPIMSLNHEDPRVPLPTRSSRLNPGSCEVTEVTHETLHEDAVIPSAPSSLSVQKQHGPTTGKDMGNSLQHDGGVHEVVMASEFKKMEINELPQNEAKLKERQEARSRVPEVDAHQTGDKACKTKQDHLAETQSSLPFNVIEAPEPPEEIGNKRGANAQNLELCEKSGKDSAIEDTSAKCDSSTSEPLRHEEKRRSQRRKSLRLNSVSSKDTKSTFEALHKDIIAPLASSSSDALKEQRSNQKQADGCSLMKSTGEQAARRRSLRRAAEKVVSYKEIPLNVKMRRP